MSNNTPDSAGVIPPDESGEGFDPGTEWVPDHSVESDGGKITDWQLRPTAGSEQDHDQGRHPNSGKPGWGEPPVRGYDDPSLIPPSPPSEPGPGSQS